MLVVCLHDFFKQIARWKSCPHGMKSRYSDQLTCEEVATLDLLQAADGRFAEMRGWGRNRMPPGCRSSPRQSCAGFSLLNTGFASDLRGLFNLPAG